MCCQSFIIESLYRSSFTASTNLVATSHAIGLACRRRRPRPDVRASSETTTADATAARLPEKYHRRRGTIQGTRGMALHRFTNGRLSMASEANNWECQNVVVLSHYYIHYVCKFIYVYNNCIYRSAWWKKAGQCEQKLRVRCDWSSAIDYPI